MGERARGYLGRLEEMELVERGEFMQVRCVVAQIAGRILCEGAQGRPFRLVTDEGRRQAVREAVALAWDVWQTVNEAPDA